MGVVGASQGRHTHRLTYRIARPPTNTGQRTRRQSMKTQSPVLGPRPGSLPKLKLRQRTRTSSSDSGCEVGVESPSDLLEDILTSWTARLEGVLGQEVARARELTVWAKEALRLNESGDEERKEEILESWRRQMDGVMEFTGDLVDCVNNDTKEMMVEGLGSASTPPPMETSLIIEEKEEDEEKEEEIMKLFWTPCIFPPSGNFPKSVMRSHKRKDNTKKKDLERKQIKIAGETPRKKNNNADVSNGFHIH